MATPARKQPARKQPASKPPMMSGQEVPAADEQPQTAPGSPEQPEGDQDTTQAQESPAEAATEPQDERDVATPTKGVPMMFGAGGRQLDAREQKIRQDKTWQPDDADRILEADEPLKFEGHRERNQVVSHETVYRRHYPGRSLRPAYTRVIQKGSVLRGEYLNFLEEQENIQVEEVAKPEEAENTEQS